MAKPPQTPYCGFIRDENDFLRVVPTAAHVLVSGPTEIGKSRRILLPAALLWGGPVVFVSSKDDTMVALSSRRCVGPSGVIDLRPDYDADYFGVDNLSFDPTRLIRTPDQAVTAAGTRRTSNRVAADGICTDQIRTSGRSFSSRAGPIPSTSPSWSISVNLPLA